MDGMGSTLEPNISVVFGPLQGIKGGWAALNFESTSVARFAFISTPRKWKYWYKRGLGGPEL